MRDGIKITDALYIAMAEPITKAAAERAMYFKIER